MARGKLAYAARLSQYQGLYSGDSIGQWVEESLRELLPAASTPSVLFRDLPIPVSIIVANIQDGRSRTFGTERTPDHSVSEAVQASCTMPFFFQAKSGLVDGGVLSNLPSHLVETDPREPRPILAFSLEDSGGRLEPESLFEFTEALTATIVRGSQEIQMNLQPFVHVIRINTGSVKATDFAKVTAQQAQHLRDTGYDTVREELARENLIASPDAPAKTYHDAQTLDAVAEQLLLAHRSVQVASADPSWAFELFTSIFLARRKGVSIGVAMHPAATLTPKAEYQLDLLRALGCTVEMSSDAPVLGPDVWLFDAGTPRATAVVYSSGGEVQATVHREADGESGILALLQAALGSAEARPTLASGELRLSRAGHEEVVRVLRPVDQYVDADIRIEEVPLESVNSWAKYALSYKQRQQMAAARAHREHGLVPFEPAWLSLSEGRRTLLLPPVVEASRDDGIFTIVNGASRLLLLQREQQPSALCAVVRGVAAPPPADRPRVLSQLPVRIGRRGEPQHRYDGFARAHVRLVEKFAHTAEELAASADRGEER